jgi:UDP-N-acetyl-alpha-D-quinovosamine dehydrogenase
MAMVLSATAMGQRLVAVTGAGGFIGSALIAHFRETGRPSRAVVRGRDSAKNLGPGAIVLRDLATATEPELDALVAGAGAVVHLAARVHVMDDTSSDPVSAFRVANALATTRLVQAAIRAHVARFIFISTVKVNGESTKPGRPFHPDDPPAPQDAYARSKLEAEREVLRLAAGSTLDPVILRLPLVYGPGVVGNFLALEDEIARGRALPLGAIRNRRSVLGVANLVEAIDAALDAPVAPRGVHFIADGESVSVPELTRAIAASLGIEARLRPVPVPLLRLAGLLSGRRAMVERLTRSLEVDPTSFIAATGWRPRHSLAHGLVATARWWRLRHSI